MARFVSTATVLTISVISILTAAGSASAGRAPASAARPAAVATQADVLASAATIDADAIRLPVAPISMGNFQLASTVAADPMVGPLFVNGLASRHSCTASVLSVGRGLLLTAAHCLSGSAKGIKFVPGYDGTQANAEPYGVWTVTHAWIPPGWATQQDPQHDYAILQVDDDDIGGTSTSLTAVVGGYPIGIAADSDAAVTVPAYVGGTGDAPISCTAAPGLEQGFPSFGCSGYLSGTSGAPWIETMGAAAVPAVVGVIGGLHQGGCTESTSYSSDFDLDVYMLLIRAVIGLPPDTAPTPQGDGC